MQTIHLSNISHSPSLFLSKPYLISYFSSKNEVPSLKLKDSLLVQKINLEGIQGDPDSKTATVAINTDDEAWSVSNEQTLNSFNSYAKLHKLQYLQLECMKYFVFPLYGLLEKAVQTDLTFPIRNEKLVIEKGTNINNQNKPKRGKRKMPEEDMKVCEKLILNDGRIPEGTKLIKLLEEDTEINYTRRLAINKILDDDSKKD